MYISGLTATTVKNDAFLLYQFLTTRLTRCGPRNNFVNAVVQGVQGSSSSNQRVQKRKIEMANSPMDLKS